MVRKIFFVFMCMIWAVLCRADVNDIDGNEVNVVKGARYEWVFIYYMSLDNDLSSWGPKVLKELEAGVVNSKVAVVIQRDFDDAEGMRRVTLRHLDGKVQREEIVLDSEDSADEAELREYFEWVEQKWDAKNYAVIFPNHGGKLNHMCLDDQPFKDPNENKEFTSGKWLRASEVGKITAEFNRKTGGKVRLLFFQQCGRGSVENLCNFVDSAEYVMASPVDVGAPNTYYTAMVTSAAENGDVGGDGLAQIIMTEDEHYAIYTLVNNSEFKKLPEKLKVAVKPFREVASLNAPGYCPKIFRFRGERHYDLKSYLQALDLANGGVGGEELVGFLKWYEDDVVVQKSFRRSNEASKDFHSGLSIYIPSDQNELDKYNFLPFYKQSGLDSTVLISPATRRRPVLISGSDVIKKSLLRLAVIGVACLFVISLVYFIFYIFQRS